MYLTMNRFKVRPGREAEFEAVWLSRDSRLKEVPGFVSFHLMRGVPAHGQAAAEGHTLYASHTAWESEAAFLDWTRSEAFRQAHAGAGGHKDLYLEGPRLEVFETVQEIS